MIATKVVLFLFTLPLLSQAALISNQDIDDLRANAQMLSIDVKLTMDNYGKICGGCRRHTIVFHLTGTISEQSLTKAITEVQMYLGRFKTLLYEITQQEKNLTLKGELQNIGNKLNETYDTSCVRDTFCIITNAGQKLPKVTLAMLSKKTLKHMKHFQKTKPNVIRNYYFMHSLERQGFNIDYAIGKLLDVKTS